MRAREWLSPHERVPGLHGTRPARNGIVFLALIAGAVWLTFSGVPFIGDDGMLVRARFEAANQLKPGDPVRVRGVDVGRVEDVRLDAGAAQAVVVMRISEPGVGVHRDARARLRWRTLAGGNMFVDLEPGTAASGPLGAGEIGVRRTAAQVEFDDLLDPFRPPTRAALRSSLAGLHGGLSEDRAGAAIDALPPAVRSAAPAVEALLGKRPGDLGRLVRGVARTSRALAHDEDALAGLLDGGSRTLATVAARRADLGAILAQTPAAASDAQITMRRLRGTLDRLDPLISRLRPGARELAAASGPATHTLDRLRRVLDRVGPLLDDLGPTLVEMRSLARSGVPLMRSLTPTVVRTRDELAPFLAERDPDTGLRNYEAIGPALSAAGNAGAQFDANGHVFHFQTAGSERSAGSLHCQSLLSDPTADEKLRCTALEDVLTRLFGSFDVPGDDR